MVKIKITLEENRKDSTFSSLFKKRKSVKIEDSNFEINVTTTELLPLLVRSLFSLGYNKKEINEAFINYVQKINLNKEHNVNI